MTGTLMEVVQSTDERIELRWMAASSLQKAGFGMSQFFREKNLSDPTIFQCSTSIPFGKPPRYNGIRFDRYNAMCIYDSKGIGCGDGLPEIFDRLREILNRKASE